VLDTNVLLQILPRTAPTRPIFEALLMGRVELVYSTQILLEYAEILHQRLPAAIAESVLTIVQKLPKVRLQNVYYRHRLVPCDQDDEKFVDCAVAANADYLITNDAHFKHLAQVRFPAVRVLSAQEFLAVLVA
jgi:putative PIN family toxin of toxin-antitoxin system